MPFPSSQQGGGEGVRGQQNVRDKFLRLKHVRIYASSGTSPGRGGPFGAVVIETL